MAERRMFSKQIIDSDAFLEMPVSTQLLYFHISMRADDDGFINNPKKIVRMVNCNEDDLKLLIAKRFIIPFESGVVVIKHWKIHNYIAKDRYKETVYQEEKALLGVKDNGSYTTCIQDCIQDVDNLSTQVRLGKNRLDKDIYTRHKYGSYKNVLLSDDDMEKLKEEFHDYQERIERLSEYIASTGKSYKSHLATIRAWSRKEKPSQEPVKKNKYL